MRLRLRRHLSGVVWNSRQEALPLCDVFAGQGETKNGVQINSGQFLSGIELPDWPWLLRQKAKAANPNTFKGKMPPGTNDVTSEPRHEQKPPDDSKHDQHLNLPLQHSQLRLAFLILPSSHPPILPSAHHAQRARRVHVPAASASLRRSHGHKQ